MSPVLDTARFFATDLAKVTDCDESAIQSWIVRGAYTLTKYDRDGGRGRPRLFTLRSAYSFAMASNLIRLGIGPTDAFFKTREFFAPNDGLIIREDLRHGDTLLADKGETYFVLFPYPETVEGHDKKGTIYSISAASKLYFTKTGASIEQFLDRRKNPVVITVHCNPLFASVDTTLGVHRPGF